MANNQNSKPALIIIDMCQDFFLEGRLLQSRKKLCSKIDELSSFFRSSNFPVVWVRQEFEPDLSDAFSSMRKTGTRITIKGTPGAQLLPELKVTEQDDLVIKKRYSAFYQTDLESILKMHIVTDLVLAGVNTHACIRTAAVDGFQRDYEIVIADEAVDSYDQQFHDESKRYLEGRVGRFLSNSQIIDTFSAGR